MESSNFNAVSKETRDDLEVLVGAGITGDFYLAGGTGLAFLLDHRASHDLDFFCESVFGEDMLTTHLMRAGDFVLEKKEEGTIRGRFINTLVSFFHYPYPLLEEPRIVSGIAIADIADIAVMKLDALASRGAKRDFIDLYIILHQDGVSLKELLTLFSKKYQALNYNLMHITKSLVYFADAEHDPMPMMKTPIEWERVKEFFVAEVRRI